MLGGGVSEAELLRGIDMEPDVIAVDAGSTDSGPHYLGTGTSKSSRAAVARDLKLLMEARARLGIPLLVGSCGTSGTDAGVDWVSDICVEIAEELDQRPKIALIYSEQDGATIEAKLAGGRVSPLPPLGELEPATVEECSHVVALCGAEPFARAVEEGADIVLGGRATDTAVLAAVPLSRGLPAGPAWHAAKIAECGGLCATKKDATSGPGGVMVTIDAEGFEVEPLDEDAACTPRSVAAHMLYENADPYRLREPGGLLDVTDAEYRAVGPRVTRVTGSRFEPAEDYTLKLEGAAPAGFQTFMIVGIGDPEVLANLDGWMSRLEGYLRRRISEVLELDPSDYDLSLRAYGWNAVAPPGPGAPPGEVGVMLLATAASQDLATTIAKVCNPYLFHFPLSLENPLPSFGFPFSPAEVERGEIYEFRLNHVVRVDDPFELIHTRTLDLSDASADKEVRHADTA